MQALDVLESLELLGSGQWGLVTASQAQDGGVSKMQLSRLAERGTLQRVRHGVYALPSADTGSLQGLRAAWLATGSRPAGEQPLAVVSGESAAAVHGLGDLLPSKYEFSSAVRRQTAQADTRYRKRDLPDEDVTWVNGLPVTSVARTLKDLADGGTDSDHLAGAVRDAVSMRDAASVELTRALTPSHKGSTLVDTNALLDAALKTSAYRPPAELVELLVPDFREKLVAQLGPQLRNVFTNALAEQLRQLAPPYDATELAQQLLRSALPDTEALVRTLTQQLRPRVTAAELAECRDGKTLVAAGRQNKEVDDVRTEVSDRTDPTQGVSGSEAG
ncbi:putative transcriptional regulator of viral defense system [Kribbella amoyensis]|uniref:Putative transcriptional regulator of viral defense system n=1 Tax=Kribbella amoyensis TaxID=996641 RepID=A0A561BTG7_9ACTN|nr:type IV toxin-antitoxin system AbiEi family antitoxin domain-containing protein [Kribbella amoyensis]TWD82083.1 putative transcriptional regulator of viral defense system [Kribbella amoyensis]